MPYWGKKSRLEKNSPPLSTRIFTIVVMNWVFTYEKKLVRNFFVSLLWCIRKIQVKREKSSTVVKKYFALERERTLKGPQISQCINSKGLSEEIELMEKGSLVCLQEHKQYNHYYAWKGNEGGFWP